MKRRDIEAHAEDVRETIGEASPPVHVLHIAKEEGILLAPSTYGEGFDGRIEYHPKRGKFLLFYPQQGGSHPLSRVRFSIAHELGHYYLPSHRALLQDGKFHNSEAGFICDNQIEREADFFAAALLLPESALREQCSRGGFLALKNILELAREWETSATCAAIRYVEFTSEPCAVLVSADGQIRYYVPSEDVACRGFQWLGREGVPQGTATAEAGRRQGSGQIVEHESHTETWFSQRRAECKVWEEAFPLGYTGLVLTMLAFELTDNDD